ncbi:MAG: HD-GYP domain-containing protein [Suilimivivens sp.]
MRRINVSELVPGMIVAEDVYNYNNQLILPKGLILNDKTITKLAYYSIFTIKIDEEPAEQVTDISPYEISYSEKIQKSSEFIRFRAEFEKDVDAFKQVINDVVEKGAPLDVDKLMNHTLNILDISATTPCVFDMLHNMREYDDATYVHCMNVALICNIFARWLRMSEEQIRLATISGLLHDVGKTMLPDAIIKKPGKLTEEEFDLIKTHPQEGYRLLRNSHLPIAVLDAVLMHHERCDGSGYPMGTTGNKIGVYAKMVAIADVYDAMTSARIYRGPLCPFKAISLFESEGLNKYDPGFIMTFLENVVNTYLLNDVRLSNGVTGTIVFINKDKLSAPTIKTSFGYLDLSKHTDISIEALI